MNHSFDVDIAKEFGVNSAIIFDNICHWVLHNKANERHFHDDHYWTYNSISAFMELFPYLTRDRIKNAIKKLVEGGMIVEGNYNEDARDRTKWYAVTQKGFDAVEKSSLHFAKSTNGVTENAKCINNNIINKDSNTTINTTNNIVSPYKKADTQYANVEELPCTKDMIWRCQQNEFEEFQRLYPDVDIPHEFRKMRGWLNTHSKKTYRGMPKFVNNWLSKSQDSHRKNYYAPVRQEAEEEVDPRLVGYK